RIDGIVAALPAKARPQPYTFRVAVVNSSIVNAVAAPGGHVILFRGLLERTDSAEELAGVLAHEVEHVLHRHVTRAIFQQASTGVLMAALVGDVSGVVAYGLAGAPPPAGGRPERHQAPERGPAAAGAVAAAMGARTGDGRAGVSVSRTPGGASASSIALAIAAGGEIAPPSPGPFMPSGLRGDG